MHSPTRVVFVQHPREARVPISTCRMAHLSLPNSELHVGLTGEGLSLPADAAVLFPSDEAVDVAALVKKPSTLVVVDGTWSTARKVVNRSPTLRALPRIALNPERPGNYRIRKEPKAHCLSTIEAVALVLGHFEGAPLKFQPILAAFDRMVDTQIAHIGRGPSRHARFRLRNKGRSDVLAPLRQAWAQVVVAYGEGNGLPAATEGRVRPELIQLVAVRPASGETFEALLRPRRELAPRVAFHLDVTEEQIHGGESVEQALDRFRAFCGHDCVVATWGGFTLDLLAVEGAQFGATLNLKHLASQHIYRSTGGIEPFAQALGHPLKTGVGRAHRRIDALVHIASALQAPSTPIAAPHRAEPQSAP